MIASTPAEVSAVPLGRIVATSRPRRRSRPPATSAPPPGWPITVAERPGCRRPRPAPGNGRPDRRRVARPATPSAGPGASASAARRTETSNDCRNTRSSCPLARHTCENRARSARRVLTLDLQQHGRGPGRAASSRPRQRGHPDTGQPRGSAAGPGRRRCAADRPATRWSSGRGRRRAGSPRTPSAVGWVSASTQRAPARQAASKAGSVFSGTSADAPRWAMTIGVPAAAGAAMPVRGEGVAHGGRPYRDESPRNPTPRQPSGKSDVFWWRRCPLHPPGR